MPDWLSLYHRLPYPLKSAAATARGRYLSRWRYGPDAEELVEAALARDSWSESQWSDWQAERLAFILHRAATEVPYYRDAWQRRRREGDRAAWDLLSNWPVLTKEAVRLDPHAFVADGCNTDEMFNEHTSGTTGKPVHIWLSRETIQAWFAVFEARARRWYGVSRHDHWAILGGQLVAPITQQSPPFWVWNGALNQLYMSSYHLSEKNIAAYLQAIEDHGVQYLLGYPSALYRIAQIILEQGFSVPQIKVAIGNAEPLHQHQREAIVAAFRCPVRDTYGMAEVAAAASECEHGQLHIWPEVGLIETLADSEDIPVDPGIAGRLIATGLMNSDMPFIRYETGDRTVTQSADAPLCTCGRVLPRLQSLEGRLDDVIVVPDGRHVGRLTMVFSAKLPIREAQIVQETPDRLRILYVPTANYRDQDGAMLVQDIRNRVGEMEIVLEAVDEVPRAANGKFRGVISLNNAGSLGLDIGSPGEKTSEHE